MTSLACNSPIQAEELGRLIYSQIAVVAFLAFVVLACLQSAVSAKPHLAIATPCLLVCAFVFVSQLL